MNTQDVIKFASQYLEHLSGHTFELLYLYKPKSPEAAVNLAKIISKLSPFLGNLIEFNTVELLNKQDIFSDLGKWERQDPGFPDTIFRSEIKPIPGLEIKAKFKKNIYEISFQGVTIGQWNKLLASRNKEKIKSSIEQYLDIKKENLDKPLDEIF